MLIMKKIRLFMLATAIVAGITSAFTITSDPPCASVQQYYKQNGYFFEAGSFGQEYECLDVADVCTFYKPNPAAYPNSYLPCREGIYSPVW
jgi:hypothetical protein